MWGSIIMNIFNEVICIGYDNHDLFIAAMDDDLQTLHLINPNQMMSIHFQSVRDINTFLNKMKTQRLITSIFEKKYTIDIGPKLIVMNKRNKNFDKYYHDIANIVLTIRENF